jgi:hypothetical protein
MPTDKQALASAYLKEDAVAWVHARHDEGLSLRKITFALYDATNKQVIVSAETVRAWLQR